MNRYEILCTSEQAKKALELGAPLLRRFVDRGEKVFYINPDIEFPYPYIIPTAEEMIGFLRSKGFRFSINDYENVTAWKVVNNNWVNHGECVESIEAILSAIDAALEYLIKHKNESSY